MESLPHDTHHSPSSPPSLHVFDPSLNRWLRFTLDFLPFRSPHPVASSAGLIHLWADSPSTSTKTLLVYNPLTRHFQALPQLGSAWSRHGSVLVYSANLLSKPRSPILVIDSVSALYDVVSQWRSQWKLLCSLSAMLAVVVSCCTKHGLRHV